MKATVKKAYTLFAKYQVKSLLEVCTDCCMKPEDEAILASLPVRDIPLRLLKEYNDSAKPEKTSIDEVKHFLPRYLELISTYQFPSHSTELSLSRLAPFNESEWSEAELSLLGTFSTEFFTQALNNWPLPESENISSILIMFHLAGFPAERFLNIWEQTDFMPACLHFSDFYFHGFRQHNRNILQSSFGDHALSATLNTWMEASKTRNIFATRIEKIILDDSDIEEQQINELSLLYEIMIRESKN